MEAIVYTGLQTVEVQTVPRPQGEGVLLDIEACGICGTDLTIYKGAHPRSKAPLILGHEFVARVAEDRDGFSRGDRVVCFPLISCGNCETCRSGQVHICENLRLYGIDAPGGMASQVRIPATDLIRIGNDIPSVVAAQTEPLAVCVHAARRASVTSTDAVAIIGAGPIGTTLAAYLRQLGVSSIKMFDTNPARIKHLNQGGFNTAPATLEAYRHTLDQMGRSGFDIVFECAGAEQAMIDAVEHVRVGGSVAVVSIHKGTISVDLQRVAFREITLIGTRVYTRKDFEDAAAMLEDMHDSLTWIAGDMHELRLSPEIFKALSKGYGPLKAVLKLT